MKNILYYIILNKRFILLSIFFLLFTSEILNAQQICTTFNNNTPWTVPANVNNIIITAKGADGGLGKNNLNGFGGSGSTVEATYNVNPGDLINMCIGSSPGRAAVGAGGGGSTGLYINGNLAIVAGAGGGGCQYGWSVYMGQGGQGISVANTGGIGGNLSYSGAGGGGSTSNGTNGNGNKAYGGGQGGTSCASGGGSVFTGSLTNGGGPTYYYGTAGGSGWSGGGGGQYGGGGGGGYQGGNGARQNGGGGGSSFASTNATNLVVTPGVDGGSTLVPSNGFVQICYTLQVTNVWTGATSSDWHTPTNWSTGTIPIVTDEVNIPVVLSNNYPIINTAVSLGEITVDANASLTVNTGITLNGIFTNNGNVILKDGAYLDDFSSGTGSFIGAISVERFVSNGVGNDQRFISSAVNAPFVSEIGDDLSGPWGTGLPGINGVAVTIDNCALQTTTSNSNYGNLFEFDETLINTCALDGWVVRSSGSLENGKGYSAYLSSGSTFEMNGVPNKGAISTTITNSGAGILNNEGWNLIGNPYPSPLSRDAVIGIGVTDAQYYEASGPYQGTFTPYLPTSNIAIAQGFQVHTTSTMAIQFTDAMRSTGASTWYSSSPWFEHKLDVIVSGNSFADKTILFYNDEATLAYEAMYDVMKRPSDLGQPTLSSFIDNKNLALNGMPLNTLGEPIPLHFKPGNNGTFTLRFEGKETFENTTIYIKDLQENIVHNIENGDYHFTSNTTENANRFEIIFIPEVVFSATKVDCEMNDAKITIDDLNYTANRNFELSQNNNVLYSGNLIDLNTVELPEGNYTLNVIDQYGGIQSYMLSIESAQMVEANIEVSKTEVLEGEIISLNNTSINASEVAWSIENNLIGTGNNLTYSFNVAGIYEIEMMVSNEECFDVQAVIIEVAHKTTTIESLSAQGISIYPNPAKDVIQITSDAKIKVEFIDVLGKTIISSSDKNISLKNIPKGIYFLKVYDKNNKLKGIEKIIKK